MNAKSMLEHLFKSGMSMLDGKATGSATGAGKMPQGLGQFGGGAAAGGILGLLLGSKGGRNIGGQALKYGSVAALGVVAFKAFSAWQEKQATQGSVSQPQAAPVSDRFNAAVMGPVRTVDLLPAAEVEQHCVGVLVAMIAAAKSDGHLDERERGLVEAELNRREADADTRRWFDDQLRRPLDPAEVALPATSPELASEMYLVSLLVADETSFMERAYLDELARQLRLPEGLKLELEAQVKAA
ncbi:tellurite resistance TerB family protein [Actimicrobium antarcticum]|uniref:DUF533 domain-containing protein n=1 Tax=Actimicrobium antarcticum TaxID=1051899 RepID=A0ABP7TJC9_9BURK